jgi:hypothetical protein
MMLKKIKKPIPYNFVLENLYTLNPYTKPMFGCIAVYVDEKIIFILREKKDYPKDNGVWVATSQEHHESLKKDFPSLRKITIFGENGGWRILPSDARDFEEAVNLACEKVVEGDPRIGKVPKAKKPKGKKKAT